ncbi:hypothetical protein SLPG_00029 [Salicola phage CGphi29]|uniref:hypothetical protein n=1 Tax=Salicola phage CGphi29 TaxID=754067 RepID=UPI0002C15801|nr:hypothetical protein SLPG_00029 [Salicola phage CGphi29]AGH31823.1 hypothetical protein SLPG_00029 [Salicola phage CGphi29]
MKRTITALTLALLTTVAAAQTKDEQCQRIAGHAERIMEIRQHGGEMSKAMKANGHNEALKKMVMEAYKKPGYSNDRMQDRAVKEFTNRWTVICYQLL